MNHKIQRQFFVSIVVITGILFAILISLTPPGADDLLFFLPAKGHVPGFDLWDAMVEDFPRIWQTQSGRLGNFIAMPFLYLMPKWIFGSITGIFVTVLILLSCRLTVSRYGSIVSWLLYATIVFALPWYDYLPLVTYAVNYVWAATAVTATALCFLNIDRYNKSATILSCILGFAAGWIHEGFGAPLCAGLVLAIVLNLRRITLRQILLFLCTVFGTCVTFLSPVFWSRSMRESNFLLKFTYKEAVMQIGPAMLFLTALLLIIIVVVSKRGGIKKMIKSVPEMIFVGATAASVVIFLKYYTGPRTGTPSILYSALGCAYFLSSHFRHINLKSGIVALIGIVVGLFGIIHLVYADVAQSRLSKEYEEVTILYQQSEDGTFYYDLTYPKVDLSLFKTSVRQFHEKVPKEFMRMYFSPEHDMVILPTAMQGFSPEKAVKSELTPSALIFKGWIVLPDSIGLDSFSRIHILTEDGKYISSRFRKDRFKDEIGRNFILVTPHVKVLDPSIKLRDVAINDHSR